MDLSSTILAKSDQLNAADLGQPIVAKIVGIEKGTPDQPVSIRLDGIDRVWRPCKTARRVLVAMWGSDGRAYVGRWIRLYCDPDVQWAGQRVGGVRISGASDIPADMAIPLQYTRGKYRTEQIERIKPPSTSSRPPVDVQAKIAAGEQRLGPEVVALVRATMDIPDDEDVTTLPADAQRSYLRALVEAAKHQQEQERA